MSNIHKNKLDCKIIEDLLPLYYDGAVNDTTKAAVEGHLNDCDKCKSEYEKYSKDIPACKGKSTSKEFALLMRKKRIKQIFTVIIASILSCSVLAGGYYLLFEANIKPIDDVDVKYVCKYTDDERYPDKKINKFFVVYSTANASSQSAKNEVYEKNGKTIYELNINTTVVSDSLDKKYLEEASIDVVDFSADGADKYPDVDVFILNGKEVWSKEKNGNEEIPDYINAYEDFLDGNTDEFGDSDLIDWITDDDYLEIRYEYDNHTIRWDYDGNVIYDSAEEDTAKK